MKNVIFALSLLVASAAQASSNDDNTRFSCEPGKQPNGLGIERLALDLSNEDPDGMMTLTYLNADKTLVGPVDYESDSVRYEVTPGNDALGDIGVTVVRKKKSILATVKSGSIDTFSVLECEEI